VRLQFYLFFEVGLVPMYFIVGIWGGERRRCAALKFFLYSARKARLPASEGPSSGFARAMACSEKVCGSIAK
jgi:hypothetical protein